MRQIEEIKKASKSMQAASRSFGNAAKAMTKFSTAVGEIPLFYRLWIMLRHSRERK